MGAVTIPEKRAEAAADASALKREFTLRSAFALAFAFISPIVALYSIFGFVFAAGGPAAWWGFAFVLAGQLLVALVFAELASKWPFEGSVYQWARHLAGETFGWFTGWAYMWTLTIALAAVAYGAAGFIPLALGIDPFSAGTQLLVAVGVLAFATLVNTAGRRWMKLLIAASICAEFIGSLGIRTVLLLFHHERTRSGRCSEPRAPAFGSGDRRPVPVERHARGHGLHRLRRSSASRARARSPRRSRSHAATSPRR